MSELNEARIRAAKPKEKPYKLRDGRGLVTPGRRASVAAEVSALGAREYGQSRRVPDVSLKLPRDRREDARKLVASGVDPASQRRAERAGLENTFEGIALESGEATVCNVHWRESRVDVQGVDIPAHGIATDCDNNGARSPGGVTADRSPRKARDRAPKRISQVLRYAIATGRAQHDVTADLRGTLTRVKAAHFAAITEPSRVGELLRAIDGYQGQPSATCALKLAPYVFVRPGELRFAEWREFDLDGAEWRIPAEKMKMDEYHLVPLSKQSVAIIRELKAFTSTSNTSFHRCVPRSGRLAMRR